LAQVSSGLSISNRTFIFGRDKIVEGPLLENFQKYFLTTKPWELKNIHTRKIDRELEILKIEKNKLSKKLFWVHRTKESNAESFIEQLLGIL
jgi:hypothetical protein